MQLIHNSLISAKKAESKYHFPLPLFFQ